MNVLVTGATGFVGGHLVDRLLSQGDTVTALVRSPQRAKSLTSQGVRLVVGDLANETALAEAVAGQGVIYHAAAMLGARNDQELLVANRDGTARVVAAAEASGDTPHFVLVSSMAAGGPARHGTPKYGNDADRPVTGYGRSKLAAEKVVTASQLSWTIVRPPVVYGPGDRDGMLPLFKFVSHGLAPMFGSGAMEISLVHVVDLADAIAMAGSEPGARGGVFYVNYPEVFTSADLMRTIAAVMGRSVMPLPIPRWATRGVLAITGTWATLARQKSILRPDKIHEFYQEAWTADPEAFMTATGWSPQFDLNTGIADTAAWYRAQRWI
ncbi:MAG TPA: NAD(P)-dependent oxidoreductase [Gemmatimonadales bacterium]|jgi:nucleoside-diphosphate-sugar epimerase